jgi:drug/metabolite transporter (DMT)-like permease
MTTSTVSLEKHRVPKAVYIELAILVIIWAANWPLTKAVLPDMSPVLFTTLRFIGAALIMAILALPMRQPLLPCPGERVKLALIGIIQIAGMLGFGTFGLQFVGPGRAAVLIYTMQLWALLLGWLIARDPITPKALLGALVGFAGIVLFLNPMLVNWHDHRVLLGNAFTLGAGINWAIGACFYRRYKWQSPFWTQIFWQILWSAVAMAVATVCFQQPTRAHWTLPLIGVLSYNWLLATGLCYWWWSKALIVLPASRAGQIVSTVPLVAVLISAAWAGERVSSAAIVSIALIGTGIWLTMRAK